MATLWQTAFASTFSCIFWSQFQRRLCIIITCTIGIEITKETMVKSVTMTTVMTMIMMQQLNVKMLAIGKNWQINGKLLPLILIQTVFRIISYQTTCDCFLHSSSPYRYFPAFSSIFKLATYWISSSYLTGGATYYLQWHLSWICPGI